MLHCTAIGFLFFVGGFLYRFSDIIQVSVSYSLCLYLYMLVLQTPALTESNIAVFRSQSHLIVCKSCLRLCLGCLCWSVVMEVGDIRGVAECCSMLL